MPAIVSIYRTGLIRALENDGAPWTKDIAQEVMQLAIELCPKGSGRLAAGHGVERRNERGEFSKGYSCYNNARDEDGKFYALWVHNGTGIYGPRGTPIVPWRTKKKKYMHVPPHMGWTWTHLSQGIRVFKNRPMAKVDVDPWGHAESIAGDRGQPWLRRAGDAVAYRHGAF